MNVVRVCGATRWLAGHEVCGDMRYMYVCRTCAGLYYVGSKLWVWPQGVWSYGVHVRVPGCTINMGVLHCVSCVGGGEGSAAGNNVAHDQPWSLLR